MTSKEKKQSKDQQPAFLLSDGAADVGILKSESTVSGGEEEEDKDEDVNEKGPEKSWEDLFEDLKEFKSKFGHCLVPQGWEQNRQLGRWVSTQRSIHKNVITGLDKTSVSAERMRQLKQIGFHFTASDPRHVPWKQRYGELLSFIERFGHAQVPIGWKENIKLSNWVSAQRQEYKLRLKGRSSRLTGERIRLLEKVNFIWEARRGGPKREERAAVRVPEKPTPSKKWRKNVQQTTTVAKHVKVTAAEKKKKDTAASTSKSDHCAESSGECQEISSQESIPSQEREVNFARVTGGDVQPPSDDSDSYVSSETDSAAAPDGDSSEIFDEALNVREEAQSSSIPAGSLMGVARLHPISSPSANVARTMVSDSVTARNVDDAVTRARISSILGGSRVQADAAPFAHLTQQQALLPVRCVKVPGGYVKIADSVAPPPPPVGVQHAMGYSQAQTANKMHRSLESQGVIILETPPHFAIEGYHLGLIPHSLVQQDLRSPQIQIRQMPRDSYIAARGLPTHITRLLGESTVSAKQDRCQQQHRTMGSESETLGSSTATFDRHNHQIRFETDPTSATAVPATHPHWNEKFFGGPNIP